MLLSFNPDDHRNSYPFEDCSDQQFIRLRELINSWNIPECKTSFYVISKLEDLTLEGWSIIANQTKLHKEFDWMTRLFRDKFIIPDDYNWKMQQTESTCYGIRNTVHYVDKKAQKYKEYLPGIAKSTSNNKVIFRRDGIYELEATENSNAILEKKAGFGSEEPSWPLILIMILGLIIGVFLLTEFDAAWASAIPICLIILFTFICVALADKLRN